MRKITTIKERLLQFIENQGIKKEEFYSKIGIDGANFRGKNLHSEFSVDKVVKILRLFPQISTDWLLFGNGEMLKDANAISRCSEPPVHYSVDVDYKNKYFEILEELTSLSRETIKLQSKIITLQEGLILNNKKRQNNHDAVHEM